MEACLLGPLHGEVAAVGARLLSRLLGEWGLWREITALRNVYLMACPALVPFTSRLLARLQAGQALTSLTPWQLHLMLHSGLPTSSPDLPLPDADALTGWPAAPPDNQSSFSTLISHHEKPVFPFSPCLMRNLSFCTRLAHEKPA